MLEVRKHIGCQYLFLFAADTSDDESLIRYYRTLHFTDAGEHGAVIPLYDWTCRFMYQEISVLQQGKEEFFGDFNRDELECPKGITVAHIARLNREFLKPKFSD